jgi:hypothetical protein
LEKKPLRVGRWSGFSEVVVLVLLVFAVAVVGEEREEVVFEGGSVVWDWEESAPLVVAACWFAVVVVVVVVPDDCSRSLSFCSFLPVDENFENGERGDLGEMGLNGECAKASVLVVVALVESSSVSGMGVDLRAIVCPCAWPPGTGTGTLVVDDYYLLPRMSLSLSSLLLPL